jgi:fucose 4-O-acetylase-like acetyltransferase
MQFFRFGVICFYIISGFLLGDQIETISRTRYFKNRIKSVLNPFLVVFILFVILKAIIEFHSPNTAINIYSIVDLFQWSLFYTPLWFLPNYFVALGLILIFIKYANSFQFGIISFVITILYTYMTVYNHKFEAPHSFAILAFVFYLWLGIYIRQNNIISKFYDLNNYFLAFLIVLFYISATCESYQLYHNKYENIYNILRISNQLYSVTMFIVLVKWSVNFRNFTILNPRKETYGIYLYHGFIAMFLIPRSISFLDVKLHWWSYSWYSSSILRFMIVYFATFLFCYSLTTLLVKILVKYKIAFLK